ncbi:MAG: exodeoxyribonuclease V subunit gamma [Moraxellaceae bacterium]|nr:exodeoxyribonuclease V subunit gamma [Moraxellaceae bacterium]MDZ4387679.1 exodeoxyribonuclease V subunit gamma [Moraxellaceae bacterium]
MSSSLQPGFLVLHAHHLESLRDVLIHLLKQQPLGPLENEVVLVQSNGMAQWLKAAIAAGEPAGLGICAAVNMTFPARFLWQAYRLVLGEEVVPRQSPFDKAALRWRILALLPAHMGQPEFAPLNAYLRDDVGGRKHWQLACQIADIFDQYMVYRGDWLLDWQASHDVLRKSVDKDEVADLPGRERWQPMLWRALVDDIAQQSAVMMPPQIHQQFLQHLSELPQAPKGIPKRIIVWGFSTLPGHVLEALAALGRHVQVVLAVVNPCRHYWADLLQPRQRLRHARKANLAAVIAEHELSQHANPLLLAWGQQGRDYLRRLEQFDEPDRYRQQFLAMGQSIDVFVSNDHPTTLLAQLQEAIHDLQALPQDPSERIALSPHDQSLRFQSAHSRLREVEALHDHLLALISDSRGQGHELHPRDIVVMVPDIRDYAPLIQAVFAADEATKLPFVILDKPSRGQSPLLNALEWLLSLPDHRCTNVELWDLIDVPALQQCFGFSADMLPSLRAWFDQAGARWGLDAKHRAQWGMPESLEQNTWRFALDRLLLGYASGTVDAEGQALFADYLPEPLASPLEAAALGPMHLLLTALSKWQDILRQERSLSDWLVVCRALLADFFDISRDDPAAAVFAQIEQALVLWSEETQALQQRLDLVSLPVVREAWLSRLDESSMSQRFLSGAIHFATLMPMRAIPFKHICILGLNDNEFPRSRAPVDFDLMSDGALARPGDRSRRDDDRYLFLEAVLSARESLLLSWVGRDSRQNQLRPPSLLLAQLRDYISRGWQVDGECPLAALTTEHALQPFSTRYFTDSGLVSYAQHWRAAYDTVAAAERNPLIPEPLPDVISSESLLRCLNLPAQVFYRERLGIRFPEVTEALTETEPFALDGLNRYALVDEALAVLLRANDVTAVGQWLDVQLHNGQWPLAGFAQPLQVDLQTTLNTLWQDSSAWRQAHELPSRVLRWRGIEHALTTLCESETGAMVAWSATASKLHDSRGKISHWKVLTRAFLQHALMAASGLVASSKIISPTGMVTLPPMSAALAEQWLQSVLELWQQSQVDALPFELKTAMSYANAGMQTEDFDEGKAVKEAASVYDGGFQSLYAAKTKLPLLWLWPDFATLSADGRLQELALQVCLPVSEFLRDHKDALGGDHD